MRIICNYNQITDNATKHINKDEFQASDSLLQAAAQKPQGRHIPSQVE